MSSQEWPGTYELELLATEIRLNDPRTTSIKLCDVGAAKLERALANPPAPNAKLRALFKR